MNLNEMKTIEPEITPRTKWLPLARKQHQGPEMLLRPAFKPQGVQNSCTAFAFTFAMEYRLAHLGHTVELDARELYSRVNPTTGDGGLAPGEVLNEIMENGLGGWTIDNPIYDTRKFDGAVSCLFKKLPVIVCAQMPGVVDKDGWVERYLPNQRLGHNMCAYKVAFRFVPTFSALGSGPAIPEWGLWCIDSAHPRNPFVAIPERLLPQGTAYYSFKNMVEIGKP